jgi:hypothetical protein
MVGNAYLGGYRRSVKAGIFLTRRQFNGFPCSSKVGPIPSLEGSTSSPFRVGRIGPLLPMALFRTQYPNLPRHSLVLCASLVENPMNLGLLCRTAEAFRLEALVLQELALAQGRKFRQVAVATHQWQPLEACAVEQLPDWLADRRQQGYTPIALDLQPQAIPLADMHFPAAHGAGAGARADGHSRRR